MLSVISETALTSLEDEIGADASFALKLLRTTSRSVQMRGWYWNTDDKYEMTPNDDDEIELPSNTLKVDPSSTDWRKQYVQRGTRLYDRENHTFTITEAVKVKLVSFLDFEDLPEAARHYITIRAARVFQDRMLGDDGLHVFNASDERDAKSALDDAEADFGDYNLGDDDPLISQTIGRRLRRF